VRDRTLGYCVAGLTLALLLFSCGPRYLSEPPPEFDDYVESVPVPSGATQLSEYGFRSTSPREICTTFGIDRLYGTGEAFSDVIAAMEMSLEATATNYVKVEQDPDFITYVLGDTATVTVYYVETDNPNRRTGSLRDAFQHCC
jgi:hypothetical protein